MSSVVLVIGFESLTELASVVVQRIGDDIDQLQPLQILVLSYQI